ncbi:MAG: D-alanyl-D-alanine carboxypeptidase/D-alanyl-D-alanine-endopeptidase [Planctomycetota bacterium]
MRTLLLPLTLLAATACAQPTTTNDPAATDARPAFAPLNAPQLAAALDRLLDTHETAKRTNVTLVVRDLDTGKPLYDRGGDKLLTPASNLKIYTAAAAIDLLGPEYTWTTGIATRRTQPSERTVVYVLGGADPMLDTAELEDLVDRYVEGAELESAVWGVFVRSPPGWWEAPLKGPGWMWDDDPDYYNMSIRGTMLNFNVTKVRVSPDGVLSDNPLHELVTGNSPARRVSLRVDPPADYPPHDVNAFPTGLNNALVQDDPEIPLSITRRPFEHPWLIRGNMKPDDPAIEREMTVHDPAKWIGSVVGAMLEARGVEVERDENGLMRTAEAPYEMERSSRLEPVARVEGKPLADAVQHFLRVSENAVGEMLLLHLAEKFAPDGEVSWPAGATVISDWLVNEAGVDPESFRLVDGSGLSRYNLISANSSIQLLDFMDDHEHFAVFFDGLPVYDVQIPGQGRWGDVPLAEFENQRVFAKPGGMSGVNTISGYLDTLDGRRLAFSLLANGYLGSSAPVRDLRGKVWSTLVRYRATEQ